MSRDSASSRGMTAAASVRTVRASGAARIAGVALFAALTAVAARFAVPLPGTAVPFTLQVVAVLLAGFLLGPRLGATSQALYVAAGAAGLPVFAAGGGAAYLLGPTGGYLLAFPLAAAAVGALARSGDGLLRTTVTGLVGLAIIHLGGLAWLATAVGPSEAVGMGLAPFLPGDALKLGLTVVIATRATAPARRFLTGA